MDILSIISSAPKLNFEGVVAELPASSFVATHGYNAMIVILLLCNQQKNSLVHH